MIRVFFFLVILIFSIDSHAQELNQITEYKPGKHMLLGKVDKNGFKHSDFSWYKDNYNNYLLNKAITKKLKDSLNDYTIKAFFGSWCGDSKKELPRFYKVLDAVKFPKTQLDVIAVDRTPETYKQSPNHEEQGLNIHRVPTFIFYKDGKEVNRIVEHPKETIERDIYNIITRKPYSPNYAAVTYLNKLMTKESLDSLRTKDAELIPKVAELTKGSGELNTFGYVLLGSQQLDKAIYVLHLNTKIFPYKHNTYDSLGEAYFKSKNYTEALKNYYTVLSLKPDYKNAKTMIQKINTKLISK